MASLNLLLRALCHIAMIFQLLQVVLEQWGAPLASSIGTIPAARCISMSNWWNTCLSPDVSMIF